MVPGLAKVKSTRNEQILSLKPVVEIYAAKLSRYHPENYEDYCSEGWLGAIQAVDAFNFRAGVTLRSFAQRRIHGAIIDFIRSQSESKRQQSKKLITSKVILVPLGGFTRITDGGMRALENKIALGQVLERAHLSRKRKRVVQVMLDPEVNTLTDGARKLQVTMAAFYGSSNRIIAHLRRSVGWKKGAVA